MSKSTPYTSQAYKVADPGNKLLSVKAVGNLTMYRLLDDAKTCALSAGLSCASGLCLCRPARAACFVFADLALPWSLTSSSVRHRAYYFIVPSSSRCEESTWTVSAALCMQVSKSMPFDWIEEKWKEGFYITALATFHTRCAVVVSQYADLVGQTVELRTKASDSHRTEITIVKGFGEDSKGVYGTYINQHALMLVPCSQCAYS